MKIQCDRCEGTGVDQAAHGDPCPKCKGTGRIDSSAKTKPGGQYGLKKEGRR